MQTIFIEKKYLVAELAKFLKLAGQDFMLCTDKEGNLATLARSYTPSFFGPLIDAHDLLDFCDSEGLPHDDENFDALRTAEFIVDEAEYLRDKSGIITFEDVCIFAEGKAKWFDIQIV